MNRLYLVRHALSVPNPNQNPAEWALDQRGAERLSRFASLPCFAGAYRVISSTEPKAYLTALAISAAHYLGPLEQIQELGEIHKATWVENHDEVMTQVFLHPERPVIEGWESAAAALERFRSSMARLIAEAEGRDLIVASHGTVLSLYLADLAGRSRVNPAEWRAIGMPDLAVVDTASMQLIQPFGAWETSIN